jgi:hypothetical protein
MLFAAVFVDADQRGWAGASPGDPHRLFPSIKDVQAAAGV